MIAYPIVFLFISLFAIFHEHNIIKITEQNKNKYFIFFLFFLSIYIGLRIEVGGDWGNYYNNYFVELDIPLNEYIKFHLFSKDTLFKLSNYIIINLKGNYILLNFLFAIFFSFSLLLFSFSLKRPFLAITLCLPYLINVVAMGYHRQAIAIAFFIYSFKYLEKEENLKYLFCIVLASLFHYTAIILVIFVLLNSKSIKIKEIIIVGLLIIIILSLSLDSFLDTIKNYISISYSSSGVYIRGFMNFIPAVIFLLYINKKNVWDFKNKYLLKYISLTSIFLFLIIPISISTAMIDRFSLYLIPFQILIFSNFVDLFKKSNLSQIFIFYLIIFTYYLAMLTWIYFGKHSIWWFPYNNLIFSYF